MPPRRYSQKPCKQAQQQGDESTVAWCLWAQGEFGRKTFYRQHHVCTIEEKTTLIERIKQDYHDAIAIFARFNQSYAIGRQLRGLAWLHMQFDNDDFETYNNRLIQLAREMGDKTGMAHALVYAAIYKECHEDLTQSDKLLEEAVTIWEQMGDQKASAMLCNIWRYMPCYEEILRVCVRIRNV
jgi:hypothetical protein